MFKKGVELEKQLAADRLALVRLDLAPVHPAQDGGAGEGLRAGVGLRAGEGRLLGEDRQGVV